MKRREFITLLGGAAATWPLAARAQKGEQVRRVGVLMTKTKGTPYTKLTSRRLCARFSNWVRPGRAEFRIDLRWPSADPERIGAYAAELVGMTPDVILCSGSGSLAALLRTTSSVKAVLRTGFRSGCSRICHKLGASRRQRHWLFRVEPSMAGKWLDLLKQASLRLTRVAVIFNPNTSPQSKLFGEPSL